MTDSWRVTGHGHGIALLTAFVAVPFLFTNPVYMLMS